MTTDRGGHSQRPGVVTGSGLPVGDLLDISSVTVDLSIPVRALAVGAHPDDIELGGGATLAKWASAGCEVHHLVLTDGSKGSWDPDEDLGRLVADRKAECRSAASVLAGSAPDGIPDRVHFLDRVDGELENDLAARREVVELVRAVRPEVVLGHDPWRRYRLHPDHRAAGFLIVDALVAARDPHFFADIGSAPHRPRALLLWEPDLPNHVENAHGFADRKIDALLCHRSQLESTMGIDSSGGRGTDDGGRSLLATRIGWQLGQHGGLAGLGTGEAFHLIDRL